MPVKKTPTITADLRTRLASDEWNAGDTLPDERSLALQYGVARNTIRKVFTELEAEGLIERLVGKGTIVREKPDAQFTGILERFLDASPLDILNLRIFIEPHTAAAAARNASERQLRAIIEANEHAAASPDLETYEYWDNQFHTRIYEAAHNEFLTDFFSMLTIIRHQAQMMEIRRRSFTEERLKTYALEHVAIVDALKRWDCEAAAAAMRGHLLTRRRFYFGQ